MKILRKQDLFMRRDKVIVRTSIIGILGNILLVTGKIIVGLLARSVSIITDAVNNLTDALSSAVTIVGTKLALKKPDKKHPFGHGRVEYVTSTIIAMIIFIAGFLAIYESIQSLINKDEPTYDIYAFVIISLAIVIKIGLGLFFRIMGKKTNSDALKASGLDALLDALLSTGTLVAAIVTYFSGVHIEPYVGILIGLFIIRTGIEVFKESISKIIGERSDTKMNNDIIKSISQFEQVHGVYDLIINNYGVDYNIASVHVEVDDDLRAKDIQLLEREIATMCFEKYHTVMTVGVYARNDDDANAKKIRKDVVDIINSYEEIIQYHGFYVDEKTKTISVDIIITFNTDKTPQIYQEVISKIKNLYPEYNVVVVLDKDFTLSSDK